MTNWTDFTDLEQYVTSYFNQFSNTVTSFTNMTSFIDILSEFNTDWILDWFTGTPSFIEDDMLGTVSVPSDTELGTYDLIVWDSEINELVVLEDGFEVFNDYFIYTPNIFTPNNDAINDGELNFCFGDTVIIEWDGGNLNDSVYISLINVSTNTSEMSIAYYTENTGYYEWVASEDLFTVNEIDIDDIFSFYIANGTLGSAIPPTDWDYSETFTFENCDIECLGSGVDSNDTIQNLLADTPFSYISDCNGLLDYVLTYYADDLEEACTWDGTGSPWGAIGYTVSDICGCSCPDTISCDYDIDGDGICDIDDDCPSNPDCDDDGLVDGDDPDSTNPDCDNDGVLDSEDNCPFTISGRIVDANGCEIDESGDDDSNTILEGLLSGDGGAVTTTVGIGAILLAIFMILENQCYFLWFSFI